MALPKVFASNARRERSSQVSGGRPSCGLLHSTYAPIASLRNPIHNKGSPNFLEPFVMLLRLQSFALCCLALALAACTPSPPDASLTAKQVTPALQQLLARSQLVVTLDGKPQAAPPVEYLTLDQCAPHLQFQVCHVTAQYRGRAVDRWVSVSTSDAGLRASWASKP